MSKIEWFEDWKDEVNEKIKNNEELEYSDLNFIRVTTAQTISCNDEFIRDVFDDIFEIPENPFDIDEELALKIYKFILKHWRLMDYATTGYNYNEVEEGFVYQSFSMCCPSPHDLAGK